MQNGTLTEEVGSSFPDVQLSYVFTPNKERLVGEEMYEKKEVSSSTALLLLDQNRKISQHFIREAPGGDVLGYLISALLEGTYGRSLGISPTEAERMGPLSKEEAERLFGGGIQQAYLVPNPQKWTQTIPDLKLADFSNKEGFSDVPSRKGTTKIRYTADMLEKREGKWIWGLHFQGTISYGFFKKYNIKGILSFIYLNNEIQINAIRIQFPGLLRSLDLSNDVAKTLGEIDRSKIFTVLSITSIK
jgi:hypothetical protein